MKVKIQIPKTIDLQKSILGTLFLNETQKLDTQNCVSENKVIDLPCDNCGSTDWVENTKGCIFEVECVVCGELR